MQCCLRSVQAYKRKRDVPLSRGRQAHVRGGSPPLPAWHSEAWIHSGGRSHLRTGSGAAFPSYLCCNHISRFHAVDSAYQPFKREAYQVSKSQAEPEKSHLWGLWQGVGGHDEERRVVHGLGFIQRLRIFSNRAGGLFHTKHTAHN